MENIANKIEKLNFVFLNFQILVGVLKEIFKVLRGKRLVLEFLDLIIALLGVEKFLLRKPVYQQNLIVNFGDEIFNQVFVEVGVNLLLN